ncbi:MULTISPECIES: methyltransferase domain-containing protein [Actinomadura]|uniref:Methyltransferase domain-containing protein n=1 Tax=Actinomadura litoris TaxID=2678616 RepID=A0A7K1L382_9ACTN|nr:MULTISPECIES: methyltransferase domain-containing protein [Actinomadura]MBT2208665.1 methyltransferase domain-containing protein [Actinomadura sp. NEAU-AAG7]MUN38763.1 methyltransferase domain-containing protein [Actinomadura litoris]
MTADASYTHGHHGSVLSSHQWRTVENSAAYLIDHLRPGLSVLDVGCGPGTITAGFARRVAPGPVTGADAAEAVLDEARRSTEGLGNVAFTVADVHALRFADDTFDIVHAHQVLQHVADPVLALREMRRVAKPGGIVAARDADFGSMVWYPDPPGMDSWLPVYYKVARGNGGEPDGGRRLVSWARAAGFTDVTASASSWCFSTPREREWWSESWGGRLRDSSVADKAVAGGHATREELRRFYEGWKAWAAAEDGWYSVTHGEIICRA